MRAILLRYDGAIKETTLAQKMDLLRMPVMEPLRVAGLDDPQQTVEVRHEVFALQGKTRRGTLIYEQEF